MAVGRVAVLLIAVDNNQATDGDEGAVTGVTDTAGNTWTKAVEFCNGQGSAQAGVTVSVWYTQATVQLTSGQTITIAFSNSASRDHSAAVARLFSVDTGSTIVVGGTATRADDGADPGLLDVVTARREALRVRATAGETNSTSASQSSNFTNFNLVRSDTGADAVAIKGEYNVIGDSTSDFASKKVPSDHSWSATADYASAYVVFWEVYAEPTGELEIASQPFSRVFTQAEFNGGTFGGVANRAWLKYAPGAASALGVHVNSGGTFTPRIRVFAADTPGLIPMVRYSVVQSALWVEAEAGKTYYIEVANFGGTTTDFDFTVSTDTKPILTSIAAGSHIINDDKAGFLATVLSREGEVLGFVNFPGGEIGNILPSGVSLFHDLFGMFGGANTLALFDADAQYVTSVDLGLSGFPSLSNDGERFYVVDTNNARVYVVEADGSTTGTHIATLASTNVYSSGVSADGTVMYWAEDHQNFNGSTRIASIKRHDLQADTPLSDLYLVPELSEDADENGYIGLTGLNNHPGEMLVMPDGSVVTWFHDYDASPSETSYLLHLSAAGAVLNQYAFEAGVEVIDHLAKSGTDDVIDVWLFVNTEENGRFGQFNLTTGTFTPAFDAPLFSGGRNLNETGTGSDAMFGPSTSCMFFTFLASEEPEPEAATPIIDISQPCPCDDSPNASTAPDPVGEFPAAEFTCIGGGLMEEVADLPGLGPCWQ